MLTSPRQSLLWLSNIEDVDPWISAQDAKFFGEGRPFARAEWDQLLGAYSAVSADPPACFFAAELLEAYPDAKVILVERDIDSWAASFDANIIAGQFSRPRRILSCLDPAWHGRLMRGHDRWRLGAFDGRSADAMRAGMRDAYRRHYATVRKLTPKHRLLEYRLGQGWEPLCSFLAKDVPAVPFPRMNDTQAAGALRKEMMRRAVRNVLRMGGFLTLKMLVATFGLAFVDAKGFVNVLIGWSFYLMLLFSCAFQALAGE